VWFWSVQEDGRQQKEGLPKLAMVQANYSKQMGRAVKIAFLVDELHLATLGIHFEKAGNWSAMYFELC
jgi:hypothetical protein